MQAKDPSQKISGVVERGLFEPYKVQVTLSGKTYRGEWRSEAPSAEQRAAITLPHKYHIKQVRSTLAADDGAKMACHWKTHSETGEGTCTAEGREYALELK